MKKILFFLFILSVIIYFFIYRNKNCFNKKAKIYQINSKSYCLLTASNQEQWERGLMFYKKPVNFDGMIFIFTDKQTRIFWNKNTYMDLNLYWMDDDKVVSKSYLPSILRSKTIVTVNSKEKIDRVVEIIK